MSIIDCGFKIKIGDREYYSLDQFFVDENITGKGFGVSAYDIEDKFVDSIWVTDDNLEVLDNGEEFFQDKYKMGTKIIVSPTLNSVIAGQVMTIKSYMYYYPDTGWLMNVFNENFSDRCVLESEILREFRDGDDYIPPRSRASGHCDRCGNDFYYYPDETAVEDQNLCQNCVKRRFVLPYHRWEPKLKFFHTGKTPPRDGLYYGVEIEADCGGEYDGNAAGVMDILNNEDMFAYISHDGSLSRGFEIITQPATLSYHKSVEERYKKAFKFLIRNGYRGHETTTAGIHVHFSRAYYTDNGDEEENISKLLYLVEKFWDEIIVYARRDYERSKSYMKKTDEDFCDFISNWNRKRDRDGHYYAVNISNPDTIELRMFRGTLNYETYMCILEFVDSLVKTAKEKTSSELQAITFEEILNDRCKRYYNARKRVSRFSEV